MNSHTGREQRNARTALLLSGAQLDALTAAHVMIFGLGGVGGYAAEALARMGVGKLTLVDKDKYEASNLNRQLGALTSTLGTSKADGTRRRLLDINPDLDVTAVEQFHLPDTPVPMPGDVLIVIDAVDTVAAKLLIIETCVKNHIPVISSMGMGNRLDPTQVKLGDVFTTSNCALSRVMRKELHKRGIHALRCVYSTETAAQITRQEASANGRRTPPGSVAYVPAVAGLLMAYEAVNSILAAAEAEDEQ